MNQHSDYAYINVGSFTYAGPSVIVTYEKHPNVGDNGVNIVFGDLWVHWFPMVVADKLIAENAKYLMTRPPKPRQYGLEWEDRTGCSWNLRRIWQALVLYRYDYEGNYPPDLNASKSVWWDD